MEEPDPVPTPRMHWTRLVLGRGHPIIILAVLGAVGAAICWFSLQKISLITQTPTRYAMTLEVHTEGCDRTLKLHGDIGSFGSSFLEFRLDDEDARPMFVGGCQLRTIVLRTNRELQPARLFDDSLQLIGVVGADPSIYMDMETGDAGHDPWVDARETFRVTTVDGDLKAVRSDSAGPGPSFSMGVEEASQQQDARVPRVRYEVAFHEQWQPRQLYFSFVVPENVRTYFELFAYQADRRAAESPDAYAAEDGSWVTHRDIDLSVSFRTDEVMLVRGLMSDSGDAISVGGYLRFGIENSDAESKRESGNVRYSAILGIGIALIVEAFVILLALGVRALATRLGVSGKPVATAD